MKILKIVIVCLLVAGVLGGGVAGLIKLTDDDAFDTKNISSLAFSVGGLDGTGAYMDTNASIYTKDAFECQGLNITLDFDNMIEYKVYFYDQNNDFVHTTGTRTNAFVDTEVPFFAKYARIVVTPTEDDVVSTLEVNKYAKQINVSVNREQGFKNYTENLLKFTKKGYKLVEGEEVAIDESDALYDPETTYTCEFVNLVDYSEGLYFKAALHSEWARGCLLSLYDDNKEFLSTVKVVENAKINFVSSEGVYYYCLDFENINNASYMRMFWQNGEPFPELYCR